MSVLVRSYQKPGRMQTVYVQNINDVTVPLKQWCQDAYGDTGYRHWILDTDMANAIEKIYKLVNKEPEEMSDLHTWFSYFKNNVQFEVWVWTIVPEIIDTYPVAKRWYGIEL